MPDKMAVCFGGAKVKPTTVQVDVIASPDRQSAGCTQSPGMPPRVSASNVTSPRGNTLSMRASNCPRASIPGRAPLLELTMARMAVVIAASSGSSGCIAT